MNTPEINKPSSLPMGIQKPLLRSLFYASFTLLSLGGTVQAQNPIQEKKQSTEINESLSKENQRLQRLYSILAPTENLPFTVIWKGYEINYIFRVKKENGEMKLRIIEQSNTQIIEIDIGKITPDAFETIIKKINDMVNDAIEDQSLPTKVHTHTSIG